MSDDEEAIVRLCNVAVRLVEEEGSAIAFAEVFKQVRDDMVKVTNRLKVADVGGVTQAIEKDIIDTLKEMIDALKKEQKQRKARKSQPKPPGKPSPPPLIDLLAELKMVRSMQLRVNGRTATYHKEYPGAEQFPDLSNMKDPKEKAKAEMIQGELKNLSDRQEQITKTTRDIATGKNKTRD